MYATFNMTCVNVCVMCMELKYIPFLRENIRQFMEFSE